MNEFFSESRIPGLIIKFLQDEITEAEHQELQAWVSATERNKEIFDELTSEEKLPEELANFIDVRERGFAKINEADPETRVVVEMKKGFNWRPWLTAAVVTGLAIGGYLLFQNKATEQPAVVEQKPVTNDVAPGKDGAILKLPDTTIILDDLKDGEIVKQGDVIVTKEGGKIIYKPSQPGSSELVYNTMTTPKGRTYRVELSDGSVAWLNAASSIHYPIVFGNDERRVEITGEVAFEVAKDVSKKFIVVAEGASTEVLGTSFNFNSYKDEAEIKITLLEGSVKVNNSSSKSVMLKPGQQAAVSSTKEAAIPVQQADVEQVMAWKNGLFKFQSTPMQEMMRQIARWYDVEVVYEGAIKDDPVTGTMPRNTNASEALSMLEYLGYKFKIEGKKITVRP